MKEEKEKQVRIQLKIANKMWNYLSESLERVIFKQILSKADKEFMFFSKRKLKQIKAMIVNIEALIGDEENPLPPILEINICNRLQNKIDDMRRLALELDKLYLK